MGRNAIPFVDGKRLCRGCNVIRERSEFPNNPLGYMGKHSTCKNCFSKRQKWNASVDPLYYRNTRTKSVYGFTWTELVAEYGEECGICKTTEKLVVDHCHTTNVVRGILCAPCNQGLGYYKDNPDFLRKAADYLEDL